MAKTKPQSFSRPPWQHMMRFNNLKAAFNERFNSQKIRPGDESTYFKDRQTAEEMNAAKLKVLEAINKIGHRHSPPPISMNNPQF